MTDETLYDALGVEPDADRETIKAAYHRRAKETHPDKEGGDEETFKRVGNAWMVLQDPARRAKYDQDKDPNVEPRNAEARASELLAAAFSAQVDAVGEKALEIDIMALVREALVLSIEVVEKEIFDIHRSVKRLERIIEKVSRDGDKPNFIAVAMKQRADALAAPLPAKQEMLEDFERALELAEEFDFDFDDPLPFNGRGLGFTLPKPWSGL